MAGCRAALLPRTTMRGSAQALLMDLICDTGVGSCTGTSRYRARKPYAERTALTTSPQLWPKCIARTCDAELFSGQWFDRRTVAAYASIPYRCRSLPLVSSHFLARSWDGQMRPTTFQNRGEWFISTRCATSCAAR